MTKCYSKFLLLIILFFTSSVSFGEISDKSINKILDLSGLTMQINQFPELIKAGMSQAKQQGTPIPDAEYNVLLKSAGHSIVPSEILEGIRTSIKKSMNEEEATTLLKWFESDLGKEITAAEEKASTADGYQQMKNEAQSLLGNAELVEFAKRLDALLGSTDMAMDMNESTGIAVYSAIMTALIPEAPLNLEAYKAQLNAASAQTREAIEQMVIVSSVYSYQNMETEKLQKYEEFLSEPASIKFYKITIASMSSELEASITKWAAALAEIFKNKSPQG